MGRVIRELAKQERTGSDSRKVARQFIFLCDCGSEFNATASVIKDNNGNPSCPDCLSERRRATVRKVHTTHGMKHTRQYGIWCLMKYRCNDLEDVDYGGRGITYDSKWESFEGFWEDMQEGYADNLEIDRIDVDGPYTKENCKWSDNVTQAYRQRKYKNNTSGKTGVSPHKQSHGIVWKAMIHKAGKPYYLGLFDTFDEACEARKQAELELYGFTKD